MTRGDPMSGDRIAFKVADGIRLFDASKILWIEAAGKCSRIHSTSGGETVRLRLGAVLLRLGKGPFIRISRFAVVNVRHVVETAHKTNGDHTMRLSNGQELTLSRLHRAGVLRRLMENS
jgi:DNA-binding LytR/AlgR family response regulator